MKVAIQAHEPRWEKQCDCRVTDAEIERDCCCIGGQVCWLRPVLVCMSCAKEERWHDTPSG